MNDSTVHPFTNRAGLRRKPGATQETEGTKDRGDRTNVQFVHDLTPLCPVSGSEKTWSDTGDRRN